jgi:hypothetical protein
MDGVVYDYGTGSIIVEDSVDCENFVESYARGNIDVGGIDPPEAAKQSVPGLWSSGNFSAPAPPDDEDRVRELYGFTSPV